MSGFGSYPVISGVRFFLAHTPGLVRHGSKPSRELHKNPALIEESYRGLRSEAMTIGFLLFLLVSFPNSKEGFKPVRAGILLGFWSLLRSPALGMAVGLWVGLWILKPFFQKYARSLRMPKGYDLKNICLATFIALMLFTPHLIGMQYRHGDWRWATYGYARWNANMEFPERLNTPGFPTTEEFKSSPYAGPKISYREYMFGLHTPLQIIRYQVLGWIELLGYQSLSSSRFLEPLMMQLVNKNFSGLFHIIGFSFITAVIIGLIACLSFFRALMDRELWWAPLLLLWGTFYVAFLYHLRLVESFRHTAHIYPLLILVCLAGIRAVADRVKNKVHKYH